MPDLAMRRQARSKLGEVDGAMALVDLDGVPATERDMGTSFARQMDEVAFIAATATLAWALRRDFGVIVRPNIVREEGAPEFVFCSYQDL